MTGRIAALAARIVRGREQAQGLAEYELILALASVAAAVSLAGLGGVVLRLLLTGQPLW